MTPRFARRLRWGAVAGSVLAGGVVAKDVLLGQWDELAPARIAVLALAVAVAALIWAWLGRFTGESDA